MKLDIDPESGLAPHAAIQTHLDGDPKPRPDEIANFNGVRRDHNLDEILVLILLPDEAQQERPFPGYTTHGWKIYESGADVLCMPEEVSIEIVDDGVPVEATFLIDGSIRRRVLGV